MTINSTGSEGSGRIWHRGFGIIGLAVLVHEWLFGGGGCVRRERYLEKLEVFEEELHFIESHRICDDVTGGRFHSLQVCVEVSMGVVAMLMRDMGLVVKDDYTK